MSDFLVEFGHGGSQRLFTCAFVVIAGVLDALLQILFDLQQFIELSHLCWIQLTLIEFI